MRWSLAVLTSSPLFICTALGAQQSGHAHDPATHVASDTGFAAMQQRGQQAMGVDQYTSRHVFQPLADGGRIELRREANDSAGTEEIRSHLRGIAGAFAAGNFNTPGFVHAEEVPGARMMAERKAVIRYEFHPLPRGGEVRITTTDSTALRAVHEFLAYQGREHKNR
jgi:uncharacterized protein YjhX (UPF0386 family)